MKKEITLNPDSTVLSNKEDMVYEDFQLKLNTYLNYLDSYNPDDGNEEATYYIEELFSIDKDLTKKLIEKVFQLESDFKIIKMISSIQSSSINHLDKWFIEILEVNKQQKNPVLAKKINGIIDLYQYVTKVK